jgi:hypothetical protein
VREPRADQRIARHRDHLGLARQAAEGRGCYESISVTAEAGLSVSHTERLYR